MTPVPLVDLAAAHRQVAAEVLAGFQSVLDRTAFIGGPEVRLFEQEYADFIGVRHCVGVANGTDALELALRAVGVTAGAEVVIPANTFIATAEAVARLGARPVLVDVDPATLLMDAAQVGPVLSQRTAAVVPVHLYGQAAAVEDVAAVARRAGVPVLEDAAQSQGARRHGAAAGSLAAAAATSFYPGKNLGAYGDAGAVLTDDDQVAERVRLLGSHGSPAKYQHPVLGFNSRMDTLQAVVLRAKLAGLADANEARRAAAERYRRLLGHRSEVALPGTATGNVHVWHLYVVRVPHRDEVLRALHAAGIGAGVHYPVPVHLTGAFACLGYRRGDFPVSEQAADQILSLPIFPEITEQQQERVATALLEALR